MHILLWLYCGFATDFAATMNLKQKTIVTSEPFSMETLLTTQINKKKSYLNFPLQHQGLVAIVSCDSPTSTSARLEDDYTHLLIHL